MKLNLFSEIFSRVEKLLVHMCKLKKIVNSFIHQDLKKCQK